MQPYIAKPTDRHLAWAEEEVGILIHYLIGIYNYNKPCRYKTCEVRTQMPASTFAPKGWDTDQWMRAAASLGAGYAILVANHCDGFSLWDTSVNDYSSAHGAKPGDVVKDFVASCKKYGLKPGLYYSVNCNGYYDINDEVQMDYHGKKYQDYLRCAEAQVEELWSRYGELFEIWFDGGVLPPEDGGMDLAAALKRLQPNAVCFQGPKDHPYNVRWVGNEDGLAPADCWSTTNAGEEPFTGAVVGEKDGAGTPDGRYFWPAETDTPNRGRGGGWVWTPYGKKVVHTPEYLLDCYCRSVGRNSNLLLGMGINPDGLFEDEEQYERFGELLRTTFSDERTLAKEEDLTGGAALSLGGEHDVSYIVLREDMRGGHLLRGFRVTADGREILTGKCVGHKRIIPTPGLRASRIAVEWTDALPGARLRDVTVYA